jgi:PAS domain S-box-containing protein
MSSQISYGTHKQLRSLERIEFYKLLVNSIEDYAIFLLDPQGVISSWNRGAQKLKGYTPDEIIGTHFSIFYAKADVAKGKPMHLLDMAELLGHVEDEGWRFKKDGNRFWADVIITALRDPSGELIGFAKVTRDLTERKKHEDAMRLANEQLAGQRLELETLNSAKDEFISLASHQLRTPVSGVKQFLGLLLEGYAGELTEQQRDYLQRAYDGNNRQIELINNLLHVAQVDAGKIVLVVSPTNLATLIQDIIDEQVDSFKDRKQRVLLDLPAKDIKANVDTLRFRMALENLVSNASKYTPAGGSITIGLRETPKHIEVKVTDTGVGIKPEELPRLFTKFSRIPNALSEVVGGSGLGLYWAQKVIQLHHGQVVVESQYNQGSTFTIRIPKEE